MTDMNEQMLQTYLEEADEKIDELNEGMLDYEQEGSKKGLKLMFRASHTLKSSSASMGFDGISELAHKMEDVFDELRSGNIEANEDIFNLLYKSIDTLDEMVKHVREETEAPDRDVSDLIDKLGKAEKGEDFDVEKESQEQNFGGVTEIKVGVDRLDKLMNLVGELLIKQKEISRTAEEEGVEKLESAMNQMERLGEDIRGEVSGARMIPVSQVFDRFPRTVRDLSSRTGKDVDFEVQGSDLRMDRTIVEELGEPIIHILRNAVDHGIESAEERKQKGKSEKGKILLKAEREGNSAKITVKDDGRGVDTEKVVEKAIEKNVITRQKANNMSEQEKLELLFSSDMSTNDEVTELSGRGVGLSVVKATTQKLRGSYSIESEEDEGTEISMKLPLSMAVTRCFLVEAGDSSFGIPINTVDRAMRMQEVETKSLESNEILLYEEDDIPLIDLQEKLNVEGESQGEIIILAEVANEKVGIKVDQIVDVEDFVSKELDLIDVDGIAGVTMLSDGTPLIILDVAEVMEGS